MQPVEALNRLIALADIITAPPSTHRHRTEEEQEQDALAISVCQAILNTALPVARYRVFVRLEKTYPQSDVNSEYTVCCADIKSVIGALRQLAGQKREVYVQVWEQKKMGAEMVSGYQGITNGLSSGARRYTDWLKALSYLEDQPQAVE